MVEPERRDAAMGSVPVACATSIGKCRNTASSCSKVPKEPAVPGRDQVPARHRV